MNILDIDKQATVHQAVQAAKFRAERAAHKK